jgi:hypothetical protein
VSAQPQPQTDVVEVHLEELGQHSWVLALLNTLAGLFGSAQFRFVARAPGVDEPSAHVAVGATFPMIRWQDLNDRTEPHAWIDTAVECLQELDRELTAAGWVREDRTGAHWWSLTYRRPTGGERSAA